MFQSSQQQPQPPLLLLFPTSSLTTKEKNLEKKKTGDDVQISNIEITSPAQEMARQREVEEDGEEVTLLRRKRGRKEGRDGEMLSV